MSKIWCPYCGDSHYMESYCASTLLNTPQEYKNGQLQISNIKNYVTHYCRCCSCNTEFTFTEGVENGNNY